MSRSLFVLMVVPAIVISACASTHEAPEETLDEVLARAWCEARVRCGRRTSARPCDASQVHPRLVYTRGAEYALDPTLAAACLELLRSPECVLHELERAPLICREMRVPRPRAEGRRCLSHIDCLDGLRCLFDRVDMPFACGEGICTPPPARCETPRDCLTPVDAISVACVDGTCVPEFSRPTLAVSGEPCGLFDHEWVACELGLACFGERASGVNRCGRLPQLGDRCDPFWADGLCAEGLVCPEGDTVPRFCELVLPADGEPCSAEWPGCDVGHTCVERTCRATTGALGQPCSGSSGCREGLRCDMWRCVPLRAAGEPCFGFRECEGLGCEEGRCVAHCSE